MLAAPPTQRNYNGSPRGGRSEKSHPPHVHTPAGLSRLSPKRPRQIAGKATWRTSRQRRHSGSFSATPLQRSILGPGIGSRWAALPGTSVVGLLANTSAVPPASYRRGRRAVLGIPLPQGAWPTGSRFALAPTNTFHGRGKWSFPLARLVRALALLAKARARCLPPPVRALVPRQPRAVARQQRPQAPARS